MFAALEVFNVREAFVPDYQAPAIDVLDDDGGVLVLPPGAPQMLWVIPVDAAWTTVAGATGYRLERRISGTIYETIYDGATSGTGIGALETIIAPAFYRVRAYNAAGVSAPSHPMFLALPGEEDDSGDSSES
jgi:hypothetical protein